VISISGLGNKLIQISLRDTLNNYQSQKQLGVTMKTLNKTTALVSVFLLFTSLSWAHDPSKHAKKPEKLNKSDCSAYSNEQNGGEKMDMSDPLMLALMKKCANISSQTFVNQATSQSQNSNNSGATQSHDNSDGHHRVGGSQDNSTDIQSKPIVVEQLNTSEDDMYNNHDCHRPKENHSHDESSYSRQSDHGTINQHEVQNNTSHGNHDH